MPTLPPTTCRLAAIVALAFAPLAQGQISASGPYHDMQYQFLAQPPVGSKVYYTAVSGSDVGFEAYRDADIFYVHAEPSPTQDLTAFAVRQRAAAAKMCTGSPSISEQGVQVGGEPGLQLRVECNSDQDSLSPRRVLVVQMTMRAMDEQGNVVYTLGMLTTPKNEPKARDGWLSMADSFRLL